MRRPKPTDRRQHAAPLKHRRRSHERRIIRHQHDHISRTPRTPHSPNAKRTAPEQRPPADTRSRPACGPTSRPLENKQNAKPHSIGRCISNISNNVVSYHTQSCMVKGLTDVSTSRHKNHTPTKPTNSHRGAHPHIPDPQSHSCHGRWALPHTHALHHSIDGRQTRNRELVTPNPTVYKRINPLFL